MYDIPPHVPCTYLPMHCSLLLPMSALTHQAIVAPKIGNVTLKCDEHSKVGGYEGGRRSFNNNVINYSPP